MNRRKGVRISINNDTATVEDENLPEDVEAMAKEAVDLSAAVHQAHEYLAWFMDTMMEDHANEEDVTRLVVTSTHRFGYAQRILGELDNFASEFNDSHGHHTSKGKQAHARNLYMLQAVFLAKLLQVGFGDPK